MNKIYIGHTKEPFKCGCGYIFDDGMGFHWCPHEPVKNDYLAAIPNGEPNPAMWRKRGRHQVRPLVEKFRSFRDAAIEILFERYDNADEQ